MSFSVTILGSNSALPSSKRFTSAHVVSIHERFFLLDCGEGTQIQLRKFKQPFTKINHIFLSHLHADHILGLPGLLSSLSLLSRKRDLHIYSVQDVERLVTPFIENYEMGYLIHYHRISNKKHEIIFEDSKVEVSTIPLKHRVPTCGFLFREKPKLANIRKDAIEEYQIPIAAIFGIKSGGGFFFEGKYIPHEQLTTPPPTPRSYAYCTDTAYKESIIPLIKGIDLLYHEATFADNLKKRAHETTHSTSIEAATIAAKAGVKKLLIGHFSSRYNSVQLLENEARSVFPNTVAVNDGERYEL